MTHRHTVTPSNGLTVFKTPKPLNQQFYPTIALFFKKIVSAQTIFSVFSLLYCLNYFNHKKS